MVFTCFQVRKVKNHSFPVCGFSGCEPVAEEAVQLICETGGVAVLAHPWALKNPAAIVRRLKDAGLHGIEAYRSDGKLSGSNLHLFLAIM